MRTRGTRVTAAVLTLLLVAIMGPVLYQLLLGSVTRLQGGNVLTFSWEYYDNLFQNSENLITALNSLQFAIGSAAVAVVIGGVQAWIAERTNAPFGRVAYVSAIVLIGVPYLIYVIAWVLILGRAGFLNTALTAITGSDNPAIFDVNSMAGMILIEGLLWSPLGFLLIAASLKQMNPAFEEAAMMCGGRLGSVLRRVTIPLAWPAVLAVGLLAFVRAIEAFEVPAIVGLPGGERVITTQVYLAIQQELPPDYGFASAFSVVLMILVGGLLWWYGRLTKSASKYQVVTGSGYKAAGIDVGRWKYALSALSLSFFAVVVALPLLILLWVSVIPVYQGVNSTLFDFTLANFGSALDTPSLVQGARNTLMLTFGAAVFAGLVASVVAWFVVRRASGSAILDQLMSLPLVVPGIVIGVAISQVALNAPIPLYGSLWVLGLGYVISALPFAMRYAFAGAIQIQPALEESALVSGAGYKTIYRRIVLPLLAPAVVTGGLYVFLQGVRSLSMPVLLASPQNPVAAVSLYDMFTDGSTTQVAAFGVLWTAVMVTVAGSLAIFAARSRVSLF